MNVGLQCGGRALEVGAGVGRYAVLFMQHGMIYESVDPSLWACDYVRMAYLSKAHHGNFEDLDLPRDNYNLVHSAHFLEHSADPRFALEKMISLATSGGQIIAVVPEGTDLYNPQHLGYFDVKTLGIWFADLGLNGVVTCVKRISNHERYIYTVGRKP